MLQKFKALGTFALLLFTLTACGSANEGGSSNAAIATTNPTQSPSVKDQSWQYRWLNNVPCKLPCWEGITPGKTNATDALNILSHNPIISAASIPKRLVSPTLQFIDWNWAGQVPFHPDLGDGGNAMYDLQDKAHPVLFIRPIYTVTYKLGEVIKSLGEPSHVIAIDATGPDSDSPFTLYLGFVYLQKGLMIGSYTTQIPTINADTGLTQVKIFIPGIDGFNKFIDPPAKVLVPWQGFQSFKFYCRNLYSPPAKSFCDQLS